MNKAFVFDMDGTLNVFEKDTHMDEVAAPGYFQKRRPIASMIEAARILHEWGYPVYTLSAVFPFPHSVPDKNIWLDMYLPFVPQERRLYVEYGQSKGKVLAKIDAEDVVMVDDYTANLLEISRTSPNVTCFKAVTDINDTHHTWRGPRISVFSGPGVIANTLLKY